MFRETLLQRAQSPGYVFRKPQVLFFRSLSSEISLQTAFIHKVDQRGFQRMKSISFQCFLGNQRVERLVEDGAKR